MAGDPPRILYQSNHLIVIDKPAGLACHAGPRGGPSVEDWFHGWRRGADGPWLAHRLDADTAGCLAIARRKTTLIALQRAFADRRVEKHYWAVVQGAPATGSGTVELPLAKRNMPQSWRMVVDKHGEAAFTAWRVLACSADSALLELTPKTGRTHQLRVHCAAIGHPIKGDPIYGTAADGLCLLARRLRLPLDPEVKVVAPVPPHIIAASSGFAFDFPEAVEKIPAE